MEPAPTPTGPGPRARSPQTTIFMVALVILGTIVLFDPTGTSLEPPVAAPAATVPDLVLPHHHPGRSLRARLRAGALAYVHSIPNNGTFGYITAPRLGLYGWRVLEGTLDRADLDKGPGHYRFTTIPGLGGTVGIAGHDVTPVGGRPYGPFYFLPRLRAGDTVTLRMPYGVFTYRVTAAFVASPRTLDYERYVGHERLVLSTCWPRYTAKSRWVVFAELVREKM